MSRVRFMLTTTPYSSARAAYVFNVFNSSSFSGFYRHHFDRWQLERTVKWSLALIIRLENKTDAQPVNEEIRCDDK